MKPTHILVFAATLAQAQHIVDLTTPDGTHLKASYFAASKPGPGMLLFHQSNRPRQSWDAVAAQLAAAGIHTLTLDLRGFGESGGMPYEKMTAAQQSNVWQGIPGDIDAAFDYLAAQPGVNREIIGVGGAGLQGVFNAVETARRHTAQVKSLVLLSGETFRPGLQFLHQASQLPGLYVVDDNDEYPPTRQAMELLYITASNPGKRLVRYSSAHDAPWLWYEPFDLGKVPASGGHGTDMFKAHPDLSGIIVDWCVITLIHTPGHAPADGIAAAQVLNQIRNPGEIAQVTGKLSEARRSDPGVQLWPEVTVSIIGNDHLRADEPKLALDVFKLNLLAYPWSANANDDLADAYLADGQMELARQYAEKTLALLDSHAKPASSSADSEQYRAELRRDALKVLAKVGHAPQEQTGQNSTSH